jgi:hypothetical protein
MLALFWKYKWWWIAPLIVILVLLGILVFLAYSSEANPFLYPLF